MSEVVKRKFLIHSFLLFFALIFVSCKNENNQKAHEYTNALIEETSPYLLQHAHNPVNWRPWSEEAFEDAKRENKLVIVSVGYSSCHWCHVMEEETFEDVEIARLMNENFISIKVDREERPDIDQVYMTAVQLMTGNSGWPLNTITLPNGKPIYGGTYHTKSEWSKVLSDTYKLYTEDPDKADEYASMVAKGIQQVNLIAPPSGNEALNTGQLINSVAQWKPRWDLEWGGDRQRQKFVLPGNLIFLMDFAALAKDNDALDHVKTTLDKVAMGGIYDHLGGGFFRYSTDSFWKVPHFEKMLYDNAQMIGLYSRAYTVFGVQVYKDAVYETMEFLKRQMRNPNGGYYAAMDAGRKGEEGKYYLWTADELRQSLGDDYLLFSQYFNTLTGQEYEDKYVLHTLVQDSIFAKENLLDPEELLNKKKLWKSKLLELRDQRKLPGLDDKIITSWNALLITGLVEAYKAFGDQEFLKEAEWIFSSLLNNNYRDEKLIHTYKAGSRQKEGFIEDYAYLMKASLDLYGASLDATYLNWAKKLNSIASQNYKEEKSGLYLNNSNDALIAKTIKTNDGDLPSPNSIMARNLLRLGHLEYNKVYLEESQFMLSTILPLFKVNPDSYAGWGSLFLNESYPYYEIAVVGNDAPELVKELQQHYLPNTLIVGSTVESEQPLFKNRFVEKDTYIYVCRNNSCKLPVTSTEEAIKQLENF